MRAASGAFAELLEDRLPELGADVRVALTRQYEIFEAFGRKMALSSDLAPEDAFRHVREAVVAAGWFQGPRVLDVGAGAGYPTVAVALLRPDLPHVDLCERSRKKAAFLEYLVAELGLARCRVHGVPLHELLAGRPDPWNTVTARAVGGLRSMLAALDPFVAPGGKLLLLLGSEGAADLAPWLSERRYHVTSRQDPASTRRVVVDARRITP